MKDAIGGSLLLYIVIFFVGIVMLFFISTLSYVKAYRVKNRIINIVEGYDFPEDFNEVAKRDFITQIDSDLTKIGYNTTRTKNCTQDSNYGSACEDINVSAYGGTTYDYCLCRINVDCSENSEYFYEVITYTQFKIPVIGSIISSSVHGETKVLGIKYGY